MNTAVLQALALLFAAALLPMAILPDPVGLEQTRNQLRIAYWALAVCVILDRAAPVASKIYGWWTTRKPPLVFPAGARPCSRLDLHNFPSSVFSSPQVKCRWCGASAASLQSETRTQ